MSCQTYYCMHCCNCIQLVDFIPIEDLEVLQNAQNFSPYHKSEDGWASPRPCKGTFILQISRNGLPSLNPGYVTSTVNMEPIFSFNYLYFIFEFQFIFYYSCLLLHFTYHSLSVENIYIFKLNLLVQYV